MLKNKIKKVVDPDNNILVENGVCRKFLPPHKPKTSCGTHCDNNPPGAHLTWDGYNGSVRDSFRVLLIREKLVGTMYEGMI